MTGSLITARKRDTIRAGLLSRFYAALSQLGVEVSIENPDLAYLEGNALATLLAGAEQRAASVLDAILPDKAIGDSLRHHGTTLALAKTSGETDPQFAQRVLAERQISLGPGNPLDWVSWAKQVSGVSDAYWYPGVAPGGTVPTLGCGIVVLLGPALGNTVGSRAVSGAITARVAGYVDGTNDASGNAVSGRQLRAAAQSVVAGGAVGVESCLVSSVDVTIKLTTATSHPYAWSPTTGLPILASTVNTVTVAGDYSALAGRSMLLNVGTGGARGGYVVQASTTAVFGGVNTVISFSPALVGAPSGNLYPPPVNWTSLRDAVFAVFDALGPGDVVGRYPAVDVSGDSSLRTSDLFKAVMAVDGVLNATVSLPVADTTIPAGKTLLELGTLTILKL